MPAALTAATLNVYVTPLVRPKTTSSWFVCLNVIPDPGVTPLTYGVTT
jgi:hypothetical protein